LALLGQHPHIEAVLTDVMMPGMSGIELAREIAAKGSRLPVVLMTGYSDKLEEGADLGRPVLSKPFKVEELAKAFAEAEMKIGFENVIRLQGAKERE
jgi:CheY-like chemotaxis protein